MTRYTAFVPSFIRPRYVTTNRRQHRTHRAADILFRHFTNNTRTAPGTRVTKVALAQPRGSVAGVGTAGLGAQAAGAPRHSSINTPVRPHQRHRPTCPSNLNETFTLARYGPPAVLHRSPACSTSAIRKSRRVFGRAPSPPRPPPFPTTDAGAHQLDDFVDALRHGSLRFGWMLRMFTARAGGGNPHPRPPPHVERGTPACSFRRAFQRTGPATR